MINGRGTRGLKNGVVFVLGAHGALKPIRMQHKEHGEREGERERERER